MFLEKLFKIIMSRKKLMPENSYVARLINNGDNAVIQKVGEEAVEVIIAAKNNNKPEIIYEVADLWFHLLVLLAAKNISLNDIEKELKERNIDKNLVK